MVFNFSAGPAMLPAPVLAQAAAELQDWQGTGLSVMEMSHRSAHYGRIHQQALADLRQLLQVPKHYEILFMQGGALTQNALIPLNLTRDANDTIDCVVSGAWSHKSQQEAARYAQTTIVASEPTHTKWPVTPETVFNPNARYTHICTNETIHGVEVLIEDLPTQQWPHGRHNPIVADMSSHILSRPIDVNRYGVIFAGAQKNIGCAGLTIVIVRQDLLQAARPECPTACQWSVVANNESLYNTPPTYAIYIAGLVFQWLLRNGGLSAMATTNAQKAELLYRTLDQSALYRNTVQQRSRMNVPFFLHDDALNELFLVAAQQAGLLNLKGHKSVGGMRASIYNAMPLAGVETLCEFLREFERTH